MGKNGLWIINARRNPHHTRQYMQYMRLSLCVHFTKNGNGDIFGLDWIFFSMFYFIIFNSIELDLFHVFFFLTFWNVDKKFLLFLNDVDFSNIFMNLKVSENHHPMFSDRQKQPEEIEELKSNASQVKLNKINKYLKNDFYYKFSKRTIRNVIFIASRERAIPSLTNSRIRKEGRTKSQWRRVGEPKGWILFNF